MLYARWLSLGSSRPGFFSRSRRWMRLALYRLLALARLRRDPSPVRAVAVPARVQMSSTPWRLNVAMLGATAVAALLTGAAGGCGPTAGYVAADHATYDAIAPEYSAYVSADAALTADERVRRQRTLDTWKLRLDAAETAAATPTPMPTTLSATTPTTIPTTTP